MNGHSQTAWREKCRGRASAHVPICRPTGEVAIATVRADGGFSTDGEKPPEAETTRRGLVPPKRCDTLPRGNQMRQSRKGEQLTPQQKYYQKGTSKSN